MNSLQDVSQLRDGVNIVGLHRSILFVLRMKPIAKVIENPNLIAPHLDPRSEQSCSITPNCPGGQPPKRYEGICMSPEEPPHQGPLEENTGHLALTLSRPDDIFTNP